MGTLSDMRYACEAAKRHMLAKGGKPPSVSALYTLGTSATHEAIHLLCQMLTLDPEKRIGVLEVLYDDSWETDLTCVSKVKDRLHKFIQDQLNSNRVPLCINPSSAAFKSFASSTVAHPSELPPSPPPLGVTAR